ncbi:MAG: hypothetical protein ACI8QD_000021 [Cyclobacteriaceae bacterium]|jgi:hypothetical protein
MKNSLLSLLITVFACGAVYAQQAIPMTENDIDMKIQTWHYSRYEKSKEAQWTLFAQDGVGTYEVQFVYGGNKVIAAYSEDGYILWEKSYISEKNIPVQVTDLLDYRIVKYKIDNFTKHTEFDEVRKEIGSDYQVLASTKTGGLIEYWFNSEFELMPEKKGDEVAKR